MGKTKVMNCKLRQGQAENSGKFPCGICKKGVGRNSIYCTKCKKWIHKKCGVIRSRLETAVGFQCTNCSQGLVAETISQKLCPIKLNGDSLECVDRFCYLGDMRVKCAWGKFRELPLILTTRRASLKLK